MRKKAEPVTARKKAKATKPAAKAAKAKRKRVPAPRAAAPKEPGEKGCHTPSRADVFVQEYLIDLNGRQAAIRAGYSPASARQTAAELLATAPVQEALTKAMVERAKRTDITADRVLQRYWAIATADPRELTEVWRCCCRFCWGVEHHYQWTPQELRDALAAHEYEKAVAPDEKAADLLRAPDEAGGTGYDPRKDPNPACPECFGQGEVKVYAKDTRDLSPDARLLYAGAKTTQHGLEVKTHSQTDALTNVGKHIGMFRERVELTGKDGKELATGVVVIPAKAAPVDVVPAQPGEALGEVAPVHVPAPVPAKKPTFKVKAPK